MAKMRNRCHVDILITHRRMIASQCPKPRQKVTTFLPSTGGRPASSDNFVCSPAWPKQSYHGIQRGAIISNRSL